MRKTAALLAFVVSGPAQAEVILPGSCYLREYSRQHLAKHPDQMVRMIALGPETGAGEADAPILRVAVMLRGGGEVLTGTAYCDGWGKRMDCGMEGDAGAFLLEPASNGAVRLSVSRQGLFFEGSEGFVELRGDRGDDRVFLIPSVPPDACP